MTKHGEPQFRCRCGMESRHPTIIRGLALCRACAFDEAPDKMIGADMSRWNGSEWRVKPAAQIRKIG